MDTSVPLYDLSCAWCANRFYVCRRDYRRQEYCSDDCREESSAASHRLACARYQRSLGPEGKQDRRDQWHARRIHKGAKAEALPDVASKKVDVLAECSSPASAKADVDGPPVDATGGRSTDGHVPTLAVALEQVDQGPSQPWSRRAAQGAVAAAIASTTRARGGDPARGAVAVARHDTPRCLVCGRAGRRLLSRPYRRDGHRRPVGLLRRRGHRARGPPPPAWHPHPGRR